MEADPTLSFREATLAGVAAYQGISLAEAEQASRAFDLYPAEVSAIVDHWIQQAPEVAYDSRVLGEEAGGDVFVLRVMGLQSYSGGEGYGVTTSDWGAYDTSIIFDWNQ